MGCAVALLVLNFICVCLSLAGMVASLTGYSWYRSGNREDGLFRFCISNNNDFNCDFKTKIFSTEDAALDTFIILILHVVACGFIFFSLISTLTMFCCMNSKGCWCCGATTVALKIFIGAGAAIAAMVYAEVKWADKFKIHERGWSNIVGWVGAGIGLVAFFLSCAMCCVKPRKRRGPEVNFNVVNNHPPYAATAKDYPMVNRGYQHGY